MSLIDDALKRAQAAGEGEKAKPGDRPWIPTPMPDAGLARRRALVRRLSLALAAIACLAAGMVFVRRAPRDAPPLPAGEGRGSAAAAPAVTPTPDAVAMATPIAVAPPVAAPPPVNLRPTRAPRPAPQEAPAGNPSPPPAAPAAAPPSRGAPAPAGGRSYSGVVPLPGGGRIELGGIVWSETEPRALLNDRIVGTGGYVEGFSVVKIEQDRVLLEKDGATISLSVK